MRTRPLRRCIDFVTEHNRITLLVMVLLTGVVLAGIPQLNTGSQAGGTAADFEHLDRVQASQHIEDVYRADEHSQSNRTLATVYVHQPDGNVLSKPALRAELEFQQTLREDDAVGRALHPDGMTGIANLVATRAAGDRAASLEEQLAAVKSASEQEIRTLLRETVTDNPRAGRLLPADFAGETSATDRRLLIALDTGVDQDVYEDARNAIFETANDRDASGYFTLGGPAMEAANSHFTGEMVELVLPLALLLIVAILAFAYRDLVDVIVGMTGVVLSVAWMFGLLGWLGVSAGVVIIAPVVLITGLSIDFGFHVFNRYREQRAAGADRAPRTDEREADATRRGEDAGIRPSMNRGVRLVATALVLVTVTAAIGFLANLANPLPMIRNLGIAITLGVASALLLFVTVVPALKISIDGLLERVGFDRRKAPLGHGRYLRPALERTVTLARRAAPVVVIVAVLLGAAGGGAWFALDQESFQQGDGEVADWKQNLPDPIGWDRHAYYDRADHVEETYRPASAADATRTQILLDGDVTGGGTLAGIADGIDHLESASLLVQADAGGVESPLSALRRVADRNATVAAMVDRADSDGDGIPDRNVARLYDALYAADSDLASRVLERTDGEYRSALVTVSIDAGWETQDTAVTEMETAAAAMVDGSDRTATLAGPFSVNQAVVADLVAGILLTMVLALAAILLTTMGVFRAMHGSATLGAVVAVPIALVVGSVIGTMYLLEIPLTLLTALLMSLVVGVGIDYNIHIGDRFADERRAGTPTIPALRAAVTGTGGALVGSTLTTAGAFATLTLVPHPQLVSFGSIVVVALVTAFLVSLLVLPSLLVLWDRHAAASVTVGDRTQTGVSATQD
ncbi:exporter of the RND superfamily protein [Halorhabdus utahensis DSM 12940]|uniref:Exporter of the RND superfamily protein n=1 Tax=Halorhabdus utahensis (strain DSM 12940 / JCM 11049 / AX-2) TaxID=519442 RepID=C7NPL5_HALUD|nr:MMPL family transporter [Halorhabdus utahensis]ACV12770.1 exporter of the RND superfamily protein [Halorhabdus utahensis DSM 12940]